jgi:RNA polymerase sigma-70 factor (ECF subfamily)
MKGIMNNKKYKNNEIINELEKSYGYLYKLALSLTRDCSNADDLLQDTMVLALRFQESFKNGTNPKAWLCRIMKNRHISIIRRKNLESKVYDSEGSFALKTWSLSESGIKSTCKSGNVYPENEFCDTVHHALNSLNNDYKNALMMCDVNELSYTEAAEELKCPVGTVMSRLHRGRAQLKTNLKSRQYVSQAA